MEEYILLIIGSAITLIASSVGFLGQYLLQSLLDKKGSLKIYRKTVYQHSNGEAWGFHEGTEGMYFSIPIWIEIQNTKNITEIVRNFNISLYKNNIFLTKMVQMNARGSEEEKVFYGDSGNYSFIINPKSITKYDLQFSLKKKDFGMDFDEIKISYFDSSDKECIYNFKYIKNCWETQSNQIDKDWVLIK